MTTLDIQIHYTKCIINSLSADITLEEIDYTYFIYYQRVQTV